MIPDRIKLLYEKSMKDTASADEQQEFVAWMSSPENETLAKDLIAAAIQDNDGSASFDESTADAMMEAILFADSKQKTQAVVHRVHFMRRWGWAAAGIIAVLGIAGFLYINNKGKNVQSSQTIAATEIQPGRNGAVLTLADGTQVVLDSMGNRVVATQNGSQVIIKNGELVYNVSGNAAGEAGFNTMTTPKGRQFSVLLPDGTRVWLNAASSIRYPVVFNGSERTVDISGEVYFEVAKNTKMPFHVNVHDRTNVEVLGTSFNVNGYENESTINTTLLEGSVKVDGTVLKPGQQAQARNTVDKSSGITVINNADLNNVMAWKNGIFSFDNMSIDVAMRQLTRWYDIDVKYENGIPKLKLAGEMKRDLNLSQVLEALKELGLKYKMENRTLIVQQ